MKASNSEDAADLENHLNVSVLDGAALIKLATEPNSSKYVIDAHNRQIREIIDLTGLPKLCSLDVSFNRLKSLGGAHTGKELRELKAYNNKITTLRGLKNNNNLEGLLVHENQIEDIADDLLALAKLKRLWLNGNRLTRVQNIASCRMLVHLDLSRNHLIGPAAEGLESLINLEYLNLSSNSISIVGNLTHLTKLEELNLSCNNVASLDGSLLPSNLSVLRLNDNKFSSLRSFPPYLTKLTELYVQDNSVCELGDNCSRFPALESLDIRNNRVETVAQLTASLSNCSNLVDLWIEGNPCCTSKTYLLDVVNGLPDLRTLDSMSDTQLAMHIHELRNGTISQEALLAVMARPSTPASARPGSASQRPLTPNSVQSSRALTPEPGVPVFHQHSTRSGLLLRVAPPHELEKTHADVVERLAKMKAMLIRVGDVEASAKASIINNHQKIGSRNLQRRTGATVEIDPKSNQEHEDLVSEHSKRGISQSRGVDAGTDPLESLGSTKTLFRMPAMPETLAPRRGIDTQTSREAVVVLPPPPINVHSSQSSFFSMGRATDVATMADNQIADGDEGVAAGAAIEREMKLHLAQYVSQQATSEEPRATGPLDGESWTESPRIATTRIAEQRQPPNPRSRQGYRTFRIPTRLE